MYYQSTNAYYCSSSDLSGLIAELGELGVSGITQGMVTYHGHPTYFLQLGGVTFEDEDEFDWGDLSSYLAGLSYHTLYYSLQMAGGAI